MKRHGAFGDTDWCVQFLSLVITGDDISQLMRLASVHIPVRLSSAYAPGPLSAPCTTGIMTIWCS